MEPDHGQLPYKMTNAGRENLLKTILFQVPSEHLVEIYTHHPPKQGFFTHALTLPFKNHCWAQQKNIHERHILKVNCCFFPPGPQDAIVTKVPGLVSGFFSVRKKWFHVNRWW